MDRLLRSSVSFEAAIDQCLQLLGFRHKGYWLDVFIVKWLPSNTINRATNFGIGLDKDS
jgi:hypothetical protein